MNKVVKKIMASRTLKFFCSFHLGDQIFSLFFLNNAAKFWPDIHFSFHVHPDFYDETRRLARNSPNLEITPTRDGHDLDLWMGVDHQYTCGIRDPLMFTQFLIKFHAHLCKKYELPDWPLKDVQEMLLPKECMDAEHPLKGLSFDVLFVNSSPLSGECSGFNQDDFNVIAMRCEEHAKTITTHPIPMRSRSTTSLGLKLSQLGELASRCKIVAGVANAPFLATFNELAFPNVKYWINYSIDRVNFDDSRVIQVESMLSFERTLIDTLQQSLGS